ncbi:hypothetical protein MLD52_13425 [Puniceicoccaceae bacterium K14]|nr:hypothetical protein [Puniceicoccaceae bacterium K14]
MLLRKLNVYEDMINPFTTNPVSGLFSGRRRRFSSGGLGSTHKSFARKLWDSDPGIAGAHDVHPPEGVMKDAQAMDKNKSETRKP